MTKRGKLAFPFLVSALEKLGGSVMSQRRLRDWLTSYLSYSRFSESPDSFHFWTGVSVIAGALRRRIWIDEIYYQWTPNFYIVFVAPSGVVSKSTTINIGMKLLRQIPDVVFGPDVVTWQALIQNLGQAAREELHTGTGEMLPMSCITIASGEFGTLLDPQDRTMVDVLTSLWDAQIGSFDKVTKTQGNDHIVNPWINIISATTPDWIAGHLPEYFIGGGFTSRCIFVYEDTKRQLCAYPHKQALASVAEVHRLQEDLVHDLEHISTLIGEYKLSPEAEAWGEAWYERHHNEERPVDIADGRFGGYFARKQSYIHKLALILTASCSDAPIIELRALQRAAGLVEAVEKQMARVYGLIGRSARAKFEDQVVSYVHARKAVSRNEVYLYFYSRLSIQEIEVAIKAAVAARLIAAEAVGGDIILRSLRQRPGSLPAGGKDAGVRFSAELTKLL